MTLVLWNVLFNHLCYSRIQLKIKNKSRVTQNFFKKLQLSREQIVINNLIDKNVILVVSLNKNR